MLKRKIDNDLRNYYETTRNALLITGARQIGKTYSIHQFGKTFQSFIEINFIEMPEAVELFKRAKNCSDILLRLSTITPVPSVAITKRYLGLRQEELLNTYDCLSF